MVSAFFTQISAEIYRELALSTPTETFNNHLNHQLAD